MCGIAGYWDVRAQSASGAELESTLAPMVAALRHRGPDDHGSWVGPEVGVALGHRRLAIIDLSASGRQPMQSYCGRYRLSYNGEVYNYAELRAELEDGGATFRGQSDTEVLAAGLSQWGIAETARRAIGMWALAVWDSGQQQLTLVRDRLGIKPLYYQTLDNVLLFGSELKALRAHRRCETEIDRGAVAQLLRYGYIPGPQTIYRRTYKLPPASLLHFREGRADGDAECYWRLDDHVCRQPKATDPDAAMEELERLLLDSVRLRMIADVPLGAFLSGGIDSSLVVAAMQKLCASPVQTFCIGFESQEHDEAPYAREVAKHLGTDHHELYVTAEQAREVIPRLPGLYDEPFADSSQIPTVLVSEMARQHVTVCLSGDGGDELFAGYPRYGQFARRWRKLSMMGGAGRRTAAAALNAAAHVGPPGLGGKLRRRALGLDVHSPSELYAVHNAHWKDAEDLVIPEQEQSLEQLACRWREPSCPLSPVETWMAADTATYLPDDILTKVDRASMSVGLEARVPLLDHRLVEFAWSLHLGLKIRGGQSKWLLRRLLGRHVPPELFERRKMGFGVPIGQWLRGPLRDWADDLLDSDRLRDQGLLRPEPIADIWRRHRDGSQNWEYRLWDVLMLQSWLDHAESRCEPLASEA